MTALIVVDMQNDFMPNGSLGIKGAFEIVAPILEIMPTFSHCIATMDWHPKNHCSFAASHPGKKVGDTIIIRGHQQRLWPIHCVQNTHGADFTPGFSKDQFEAIFHKGIDVSMDVYSAFYDNAHEKSTGLAEYLHQHHISHIVLVGVALDYCVFYSALDARRGGFKVTIIPDLCRSIDTSAAKLQETLKILRLYDVEIQTA